MSGFPVTALRSVDLQVPDLVTAERFYTTIWGLKVAARDGGSVWLHATGDDHHVLALHPGAEAAIRSVTFRAVDNGALHQVLGMALAQGAAVLAQPAPLAEPGGGLAFTLRDPAGSVFRIVAGDERRAPDAPTRDTPDRLAHVNLNCRDVDATARFFEAGLGFRLADRSKLMAFERCNSDHHAVVLAEAPVDGLNHVAFNMPGWECVMRGAGRMIDAGFPIAWGVGRHGPGDNVFAYFIDPFGIVIEYTAEVEQVGDDHVARGPDHWTWPPGRTDQWGIAPPKPETTKKAQLAIRFA
ncbi:glyoxalase [Roseomonas stagni]|uniref:Glyoxalase n=1 Tax=Falsiroseomonas algicola TaxID=2716930 RepID=A0A6M1LKQ4_9PROT|nr:VOC family protein [Falsiroseomonas algicola]NGM20916.1 glyoxalase [Falsiroseomonas algicola]